MVLARILLVQLKYSTLSYQCIPTFRQNKTCQVHETLSVSTPVNTLTNFWSPVLTFSVWRSGGGVATLLLLMCPAGAGVQLLQHDGTQLVEALTVQPRLLPDAVDTQHVCRQALGSTTPKSVRLLGEGTVFAIFLWTGFIHLFSSRRGRLGICQHEGW